MIGKTLAHYEITGELGQGGMGEVYRARDAKLGRDVAIKILPADMAQDETRLKRFQREAQTVAGLDHPNIVSVHAIETVGDITFMVMQLVEGETLRSKLGQGALSLEEILQIAAPLSDALGEAHEAGVTHRDLKPGNVVVGDNGRVYVLDFGLAKLDADMAEDTGDTRTMVEHLTGEGQIVGTVAYMSPEQAQGKPVDGRSDIFSFGIVLHQMATGELPFQGDNQISVITAILRDQPELVTSINTGLPRHLARIVRRCLQKDPNKRYQSAKDLRLDVETLQIEVESGEWSSPEIPMPQIAARRGSGMLWQLGIALLLLGFVGGWFLGKQDDGTPAAFDGELAMNRPTRLLPLVIDAGEQNWPSLTPDGEWVAYDGRDGEDYDIFLRAVDGLNSINLTESSSDDDVRPVFSPDGRRILFRSERQGGGLFTMGRTGESVRKVAENLFDPSWSPDGEQVVGATQMVQSPYGRAAFSDLQILDLASGELRDFLTTQDAVEPDWSPNGKYIAFWGLREGSGQRDLWTISVADGSLQEITSDASTEWNPNWSPDGSFLYFSSDRGGPLNLWRVAMDSETGRAVGEPQAITLNGSSIGTQPTFAADGRTLAYRQGEVRLNIFRLAFDPERLEVVGPPEAVTSGAQTTIHPNPSPNGEWLAFTTGAPENEDIYIMRFDGTERTQLTDDAAKDRRPMWSPDGQSLAFYSDRGGDYSAWVVQRDGRGLRRLFSFADSWVSYSSWHPSGEKILADMTSLQHAGSSGAVEIPVREGVEESDVNYLWRNSELEGRLSPSEWHLDGRRVAANYYKDAATYASPAVFDTSTGEFEAFDDILSRSAPQWLPGTDYLITATEFSLVLIDTTSSLRMELVDFYPHRVQEFFSISRDGRSIYLSLRSEESDIWLLKYAD